MTTAARRVLVHPSAEVLANAVAARLVTALADAQAERGEAHVVLTGGTIGTRALAALAQSPAREAVDWSRVHVWWGDERHLPAGDADRNCTQAEEALLRHLPLREENVHLPPAADGAGPDVDAAARAYAGELAAAAGGDGVPDFDVLLLGVGPDGHVASLFPGQEFVHEAQRTVVGVPDSPKPPPARISLTLPAIGRARQVWLVAAGAEKAEAVAAGLAGADVGSIPAAGAAGREATLWLLDEAAASRHSG
ncbi:6-phosphogluconolactonase [Kineococcus xinjiangensis]|uniref:6-phosphogluconolactonase n=1 Tax=Kineococcus xinjiangensis TaxID=512762 RepID=A0A2S6IPM5_9ACTN|nr:6-phosphogluconolactonase [Kineococcus xinjiangensis]PPK96125.1 6-phosphogluconolactonase [Kineococcus xinjiangensis]